MMGCLSPMATKKRSAAKSKAAPNLFAVLGNDEALVKEEALKLCNKLSAPDAGDFGNDVIDGVSENSAHAAQVINQTIQALQTLPFFGGEKVVWLKNANFLGDNITGKAAATLDALEALGDVLEEGVPEDVKFILSATEIYKVRRFYKRLVKVANVEVHDMPDTSKQGWEQQVMRMVESRARELGLGLRPRGVGAVRDVVRRGDPPGGGGAGEGSTCSSARGGAVLRWTTSRRWSRRAAPGSCSSWATRSAAAT